jgi:hypothetical protein
MIFFDGEEAFISWTGNIIKFNKKTCEILTFDLSLKRYGKGTGFGFSPSFSCLVLPV